MNTPYNISGPLPCLHCNKPSDRPDHYRGCPLAPEPTKEDLMDLSLAIEAGWRADNEWRLRSRQI